MSTPLKVLIVEDNPADADLLVLNLSKEGYKVDWWRVESSPAYLDALKQPYDVILSDWNLPQFSGSQALALKNKNKIDTPFIIVSGAIGELAAVEALHNGAADYLLKDRMERLGQAVSNALDKKHIQDQVQQTQMELAASEAELRALFAGLNDVVLVLDRDGLYKKVAPTKPTLLARPAEDLVGLSLPDLFPAKQAEELGRVIKKALDKQQIFNVEYSMTINNNLVWFDASISPMTRDEVIWVAHDITLRKKAAAAIERKSFLQEKMAALGRELAATLNLEIIYKTAQKYLQEMVDCPYYRITLFDSQKELLTVAFSFSNGEIIDPAKILPKKYDPGSTSRKRSTAIALKKTMIVNRPLTVQETRGVGKRPNRKVPLTSIYIPMLVEGQVLGLIDLQSFEENAYTEEDGEWLSVVANQIGLSIRNSHLLIDLEKRVEELSALHTIESAVVAHLNPQETLEIAIEEILNSLEVDAVSILRLNPQTNTLDYASGRGFATKIIEETHLRIGESFAGLAAENKKTIYINDIRGELKNITGGDWITEKFVSYAGVPLIANNNVIGVCEVFHRSKMREDTDWLRTLETLAGQAALVIDHLQIFEALQKANVDLLEAYDATIAGWSRAMDLRDKETENHTSRVTELTIRMAEKLGLSSDQIIQLRRGALLHDIGKLGVPDEILFKTGKLSDDEWKIMRKHPSFAFEMLNSIEYLRPALEIPYCHHEKWDGSGYPRGLKGKEIPYGARLFMLSDVYDALTSDRPYRTAWTSEAAQEHIVEQSGKHFDPEVVDAFISLVKSGELNKIIS